MQTNEQRRVVFAFGTRPEAIKMAPIIHAAQAHPQLDPVVVSTAQHQDLLDQVLEVFDLITDHDLDIGANGHTLTDITTRALTRLAPLLETASPDAVVVQGDTTTAFAGALAAFYHRIPVVHVEAGLRTGDKHAPFPEEMNRRLAGRLADLHLAPTTTARDNLLGEGVEPHRVLVTGNSVIDALQWTIGHSGVAADEVVPDRDRWRQIVLVTAHRRESWGGGMAEIGQALAELADGDPGLLVLFPMHPNPAIRAVMHDACGGRPNLRLIDALPYAHFAAAMSCADVLLTDSGGVQEEGPGLGKPVLVMRETTERYEAVAAGTARLVGTDRRTVVAAVRELLDDRDAYDAMVTAVNPYGDGRAAERSIGAMLAHFGLGPMPEPFVAEPLVIAG